MVCVEERGTIMYVSFFSRYPEFDQFLDLTLSLLHTDYRHQEDENVASRGAISMKSAILRRSASDKLRFEIHAATHGKSSGGASAPATGIGIGYALGYAGGGGGVGSHSQQKWYIKGNHVAEVNRWCVAIGRAIEWAQRGRLGGHTGPNQGLSQSGQGSPAVPGTPVVQAYSLGSGSGKSQSSGGHGHGHGLGHGSKDSESERGFRGLAMGLIHGHGGGESKTSSLYGSVAGEDDRDRDRQRSYGKRTDVVGDLDLSADADSDSAMKNMNMDDNDNDDEEDEYHFGDDGAFDGFARDDSSDERSMRAPPHEAGFAMQGNTMVAQLELAVQLAERFPLVGAGTGTVPHPHPHPHPPLSSSSSSSSTSVSSANPSANATQTHLQTIHAALLDALASSQELVAGYVAMSREREAWWRGKLRRERERGEVWEESLRVVVREGEELERELRGRVRGVGDEKEKDRVGNAGSLVGTVRRTPSLALSAPLPSLDPVGLNLAIEKEASVGTVRGMPPVAEMETKPETQTVPKPLPAVPAPIDTVVATAADIGADVDESLVDTDEEDEFFDAIESNTLPNVIVPDALAHAHASSDSVADGAGLRLDVAQYEGYANLRTKLPIERDTRPPTSLWSVLKHSIGKDLTKISFPVFFNEPTSMLQRMVGFPGFCFVLFFLRDGN